MWTNKTVYYMFKVLAYVFLPVWLSIFIIFLTGEWSYIHVIWDSGSLFVYTVALLVSANEVISGYSEKKPDKITFVRTISWLLIILSAVGFTLTNAPATFTSVILLVPWAVATSSVVFVAASFSILAYCYYTSEEYKDSDAERSNDKKINDIMNDLP